MLELSSVNQKISEPNLWFSELQFRVKIGLKDLWFCEHIFGLLNFNLELKLALRPLFFGLVNFTLHSNTKVSLKI